MDPFKKEEPMDHQLNPPEGRVPEKEKPSSQFLHDLREHEVLKGFKYSEEAMPHGVEADIEQLLEVRRALTEPKLKPDILASLEREKKVLNARIVSSLGEGGEEALKFILKEQEEFGKEGKKLKR